MVLVAGYSISAVQSLQLEHDGLSNLHMELIFFQVLEFQFMQFYSIMNKDHSDRLVSSLKVYNKSYWALSFNWLQVDIDLLKYNANVRTYNYKLSL